MTLLFAILWFSATDSTSIVANKIVDYNTIHLLNNVEILKDINNGEISVRVFELRNEPGSAGQPNGEVTSNIYFAVSEYGEYPEQNLYLIKSLFAPKIEKIFKEKESIDIELSFVVGSNRQRIIVSVSLSKCVVRKK